MHLGGLWLGLKFVKCLRGPACGLRRTNGAEAARRQGGGGPLAFRELRAAPGNGNVTSANACSQRGGGRDVRQLAGCGALPIARRLALNGTCSAPHGGTAPCNCRQRRRRRASSKWRAVRRSSRCSRHGSKSPGAGSVGMDCRWQSHGRISRPCQRGGRKSSCWGRTHRPSLPRIAPKNPHSTHDTARFTCLSGGAPAVSACGDSLCRVTRRDVPRDETPSVSFVSSPRHRHASKDSLSAQLIHCVVGAVRRQSVRRSVTARNVAMTGRPRQSTAWWGAVGRQLPGRPVCQSTAPASTCATSATRLMSGAYRR